MKSKNIFLLVIFAVLFYLCFLKTTKIYAVSNTSIKKEVIQSIKSLNINNRTLSISRGDNEINNKNNPSNIAEYAMSFIGSKYEYGACGSQAFDCSGFTMYVMNKFNIKLPHSAKAQYSLGYEISKDQLLPGDLVFFATEDNNCITHVGIYIGDNNFVHASCKGVIMSNLSESYYSNRYITGVRLV